MCRHFFPGISGGGGVLTPLTPPPLDPPLTSKSTHLVSKTCIHEAPDFGTLSLTT